MWTSSRSLTLSRILTWVFVVAGYVCVPFLSLFLGFYYDHAPVYSEAFRDRNQFVIVHALWLAGLVLPAEIVMFSLLRLLKNIAAGAVFTPQNISHLRGMSWCCFVAGGTVLAFILVSNFYRF